MRGRIDILNVSLDNISLHELLNNLKCGGTVFTLNVDHLAKLHKNSDFHQAYLSSTYCVCDSQILKWISALLGEGIKEKISGSDLLPEYINYFRKDQDVGIFLLGAAEGIAKRAQKHINRKIGRPIVVDIYSPSYGFENNLEECQYIVDRINQSGATTLAVGLGAPKQENWIHLNKHKLPNIKVFLAVGAAIDFEAGHLKRCPQWMSDSGLEWLYRLVQEPKRLWRRYLVECFPVFWLLLQQRLNLYTPPTFEVKRDRGLIR